MIFINQCEFNMANKLEHRKFIWHPVEECLRKNPELINQLAHMYPRKYSTITTVPTRAWYSDDSMEKPTVAYWKQTLDVEDEDSFVNIEPMKYVTTTGSPDKNNYDGDDDDDEDDEEREDPPANSLSSSSGDYSNKVLFEDNEEGEYPGSNTTDSGNNTKSDNSTFEEYHSSIGILDYNTDDKNDTDGDPLIKVNKTKISAKLNITSSYSTRTFSNTSEVKTLEADTHVAVKNNNGRFVESTASSNLPVTFSIVNCSGKSPGIFTTLLSKNSTEWLSRLVDGIPKVTANTSKLINVSIETNGNGIIASYENGQEEIKRENYDKMKAEKVSEEVRYNKETIVDREDISSSNVITPSASSLTDLKRNEDAKRENKWFRLWL